MALSEPDNSSSEVDNGRDARGGACTEPHKCCEVSAVNSTLFSALYKSSSHWHRNEKNKEKQKNNHLIVAKALLLYAVVSHELPASRHANVSFPIF